MSAFLPNLKQLVAGHPNITYVNTPALTTSLFTCSNTNLGCTGPQTDPAVRQALGVLSKRVCQPDLVDHPDVEPDVHAQHSEVGEKHRVLRLLRPRAVRCASRSGLRHRHQVPLRVVAGRQ